MYTIESYIYVNSNMIYTNNSLFVYSTLYFSSLQGMALWHLKLLNYGSHLRKNLFLLFLAGILVLRSHKSR